MAEPDTEEVVVHDEPVRIPFGALPPAGPPPSRSTLGPALMYGSAGAMWSAAALVSGETLPALASAGWIVLMGLDMFSHRRK